MYTKKIFWVAPLQAIASALSFMVGGMVGGIMGIIFTGCLVAACSTGSEIVYNGITSIFAWTIACAVVVGIGKITKVPGSMIGCGIVGFVGFLISMFFFDSEFLLFFVILLPVVGYYFIKISRKKTEAPIAANPTQ